jgi:cell division protein FtsB
MADTNRAVQAELESVMQSSATLTAQISALQRRVEPLVSLADGYARMAAEIAGVQQQLRMALIGTHQLLQQQADLGRDGQGEPADGASPRDQARYAKLVGQIADLNREIARLKGEGSASSRRRGRH